MAYYHCHIGNVSRKNGSSSCASLAYITGLTVCDERTGMTYKYGRQERIVTYNTLLPSYAPVSFKNPIKLFNAVELHKKASNARTAKKVDAALPREFSEDLRVQVVEDYIRKNLISKGYCVTYAIHCDSEGENPHAHMLITNRQLTEKGTWSFSQKKDYVYALDQKGKPKLDEKGNKIRVPIIDKKTGKQKIDSRNRKQWKRVVVEDNPLNNKKFLQSLRDGWAAECNLYLDDDNKITSKSFKKLGINREPTIHEGYAARKLEQEGGISERCERNRQIRDRNRKREQKENKISSILSEIRELRRRITRFGKGEEYEQSDGRTVDGRCDRFDSKSSEKAGSARRRKPEFETKNRQERFKNSGASREIDKRRAGRELQRAAFELAESVSNITTATQFEEGDHEEERAIRENNQRMLRLTEEVIRSIGNYHQALIRESRTALCDSRAAERAAAEKRAYRDFVSVGSGAEESTKVKRKM